MEVKYDEEEESASHDFAEMERFLGRFRCLNLHVFDARGSAVMVVVELLQNSEVMGKI